MYWAVMSFTLDMGIVVYYLSDIGARHLSAELSNDVRIVWSSWALADIWISYEIGTNLQTFAELQGAGFHFVASHFSGVTWTGAENYTLLRFPRKFSRVPNSFKPKHRGQIGGSTDVVIQYTISKIVQRKLTPCILPEGRNTTLPFTLRTRTVCLNDLVHFLQVFSDILKIMGSILKSFLFT